MLELILIKEIYNIYYEIIKDCIKVYLICIRIL